jgi:hypothetical protein
LGAQVEALGTYNSDSADFPRSRRKREENAIRSALQRRSALSRILDRLQKALDNQYYLVFLATPKKKAGFQRVNIQTEVDNAEILAPDNVWVPAPK